MAFYTGLKLNQSICEMLNIDPTDVYRIVIDCRAREVARVTIYSYARTDEGKLHKFADIVKHYEIREIK